MKSTFRVSPAGKILLHAVFCGLFVFPVKAQKARDVLEHGKRIRAGNKLFLKKVGTVLKYEVGDKFNDPTTLPDSSIFLVEKEEVNIYVNPLNPLNFSYKINNVVIVDPVSEDEAAASKSILDALSKLLEDGTQHEQKAKNACVPIQEIATTLKSIQDSLANSQKDNIARIFRRLQKLDFEKESATKDSTTAIHTAIAGIEDHFTRVEDSIKQVTKRIDLVCDAADEDITFVIKYTLKSMTKDIQTLETEQKKRVTNLNAVYKLVDDARTVAATGTNGVEWMFPLDPAPATEGKVSVYTITIFKSGYDLNGDNEIVPLESKEELKRTFRVRTFRRFIPEVSAGTAYTFFKYPEYGTTKDAAGNTVVAETKQNTIRNLKFTAMINYNFFLTNSPVHPFWQLGIGTNSDVPTLFAGIGIRSNMNGIRRIAIATGFSSTWIKQLNKLSVGSPVGGTADLEKDLTYQFYWPLKHYVAFQINF